MLFKVFKMIINNFSLILKLIINKIILKYFQKIFISILFLFSLKKNIFHYKIFIKYNNNKNKNFSKKKIN